MHELRALVSRLLSLFRRGRLDADLDAELESHLELLTDELRRGGLSEDEARLAARRELGGIAQVKEAVRDQRGLPFLETLLQDLRFGLRGLARHPGFTTVAVLTLALGIGGNTAIFSAVQAVLLSGLPVPEPERLVVITTRDAQGGETSDFSYPMFRDLRDGARPYLSVLATAGAQVNLSAPGVREQVKGELVSGGYFETLGVRPLLGRFFTAAEDVTPGAHPVAVLSHGAWLRRFGGDPSVVGREVLLNGRSITVVGIAPPEFRGLDPTNQIDVRIPMTMATVFRPFPANRLQNRRQRWMRLTARLAPGVTRAGAQASLDALFRNVRAAELPPPSSAAGDYERRRALTERVVLLPGARGLGHLQGAMRMPLLLLQGVAAVVLLIACANIANLMLARNAARRHEIAVRASLGAGRGRLLRQWLTESLLLSAGGGAAGLLLALLLHAGMRSLVPPEAAGLLGSALDPRVLAFALAASALTGLLTGLAPALQAVRSAPFAALRGEAAGGSDRLLSLRGGLVLAQVALAVPLLVAAALLAGTLRNLHRVDTGFARQNLVLASLNPSLNGLPQPRIAALYRELLDGARALPGVTSAALAGASVLSGDWDRLGIAVEGYTPRQGESMSPNANHVSPGYFGTMGMQLVLGRDFTEADALGAPKVAVVNETMARAYFGGASPIGRRFTLEPGGPFDVEIVGLVRDAKYVNLRERTPRHFYVSVWQSPRHFDLTLHLRTGGDPAALIGSVRDLMRRLDPAVPLYGITTLEAQIETSLVRERLVSAFSTTFGLLALLLATIGLYGVVAFSVAQRTREIGIRLALGGQRRDVVALVVRHVSGVVGTGLLAGFALSLGAGRALGSLLYGVTPGSRGAYAGATLLLALVAAVAAYLPARRAASVDPVRALRCE